MDRWHYRFKRWLYPNGRPSRLAKAMNWVSAVLHSSGLILPNRLVTLEVPGRRTGRIISFPLVMADHAGKHYLVSMLGERANWVGNVRAAGGQAVLRHGVREAVRLEEVPVGERAPIIRRYLAVAPGARPHVPLDRNAPLAEFERIAKDIPVFRVTPVRRG